MDFRRATVYILLYLHILLVSKEVNFLAYCYTYCYNFITSKEFDTVTRETSTPYLSLMALFTLDASGDELRKVSKIIPLPITTVPVFCLQMFCFAINL